MHYYVVGINGSGKTSLLKAIAAQTGIDAIQGTAALMEYLGIPGDYDSLRAMNQTEVLEKWAQTAESLLHTHPKPFLLDTHILNLTKGQVIRRDGPWIGKYDALILVTADPATILARITKDVSKDRALFPDDLSGTEKLHILDAYQQQTEKLFKELSKRFSLPSLVIHNDGNLQDGVDQFVAFKDS